MHRASVLEFIQTLMIFLSVLLICVFLFTAVFPFLFGALACLLTHIWLGSKLKKVTNVQTQT